MKNKKSKFGQQSPEYKTSKELQAKIEKYFESEVRYKTVIVGSANNRRECLIKVPTITGLCLYLGFESRQSFYDYEKKEEFSYTIKKARMMIEREYEEQLQTTNPTGAIFALKNFDWKDKFEMETPPATINIFVQNILTKAGLNGQPERETTPSNSEIKSRLN